VYLYCDDNQAKGQPISRIVAMAKDAGVPVKKVDSRKLDSLSNGLNHQGVRCAGGSVPLQRAE
jgi:23S rRNA (guanosine2251-2'-O)-methyltransferase